MAYVRINHNEMLEQAIKYKEELYSYKRLQEQTNYKWKRYIIDGDSTLKENKYKIYNLRYYENDQDFAVMFDMSNLAVIFTRTNYGVCYCNLDIDVMKEINDIYFQDGIRTYKIMDNWYLFKFYY